MRRLVAITLLSAAVLAPCALAHGEKLSPKALYKALLKIPKGETALPNGYESPTLGPIAPSSMAKSHHVIGDVVIGVAKAGTDGARIFYIVFPTHADALADWRKGTSSLPKSRRTPPSYVPKPAALFDAPAKIKNAAGKTVTVGTTTLAYVTGTIIIEVITSSTSSTKHGDIAGTIALGQFGASHLASVIASATPAPPAGPIA
jgi:hypothetical protein